MAACTLSPIQRACEALPSYSPSLVASMFVDRGEPGQHMKTLDLESVIRGDIAYQFDGHRLVPSALAGVDLEEAIRDSKEIEKPIRCKVAAVWDKTIISSGAGDNALGGNGCLQLSRESVDIPCIEATESSLAYYGAKLIRKGEVVRFPTPLFPLWRMSVGEDYFPAMSKDGKMYLEYHHDQPHYHQSVKGGGCYLLARWNKKGTRLSMTGFRIPDGLAVYTGKGAIHCDAGLTGDLVMGYTASEDFSTVLWRTAAKLFVDVRFKDHLEALPSSGGGSSDGSMV